jgi:hypothetical protein
VASGLELRKPNSDKSKDDQNPNRKYSDGVPYRMAYFHGKLIIDAKEQTIVREIMKLHQSGTSYNAIAKHLNNKKVPTRLNGKWRDSTIKLIIVRQKKIKQNGCSYEKLN